MERTEAGSTDFHLHHKSSDLPFLELSTPFTRTIYPIPCTPRHLQGLIDWFRELLQWLLVSPKGNLERQQTQHPRRLVPPRPIHTHHQHLHSHVGLPFLVPGTHAISHPIPVQNLQGLIDWFRELLQWLLESPKGNLERHRRNNHGVWFHQTALAIALHVGDVHAAKMLSNDLPWFLIDQQMEVGMCVCVYIWVGGSVWVCMWVRACVPMHLSLIHI